MCKRIIAKCLSEYAPVFELAGKMHACYNRSCSSVHTFPVTLFSIKLTFDLDCCTSESHDDNSTRIEGQGHTSEVNVNFKLLST